MTPTVSIGDKIPRWPVTSADFAIGLTPGDVVTPNGSTDDRIPRNGLEYGDPYQLPIVGPTGTRCYLVTVQIGPTGME